MLTTNRNFFLVLLLSIVTFGIYQLYLVHCFAKETNTACAADGKSTTGLLGFFFLSLITFGIYGIVWQVMWANRCNNFLRACGQPEGVTGTNMILCYLFGTLTLGIWPLVNYARMITLQNRVNETYNGYMAASQATEGYSMA